jgi:hypothetical protein
MSISPPGLALGHPLSSGTPVRHPDRMGSRRTAAGRALLILLGTVKPDLRDAGFAVSMAILGVGMGLIASQLGNGGLQQGAARLAQGRPADRGPARPDVDA